MRINLPRTTSFVLALIGSAAFAAAQQPSPPISDQQQSRHDKAQETTSGKAGKDEPSSHAPSARPEDSPVLVNGALSVPGAATDTDTVPSKFSEKNAADDKLITIAYTFKTLTDEERRLIYRGLKDEAAGSAFNADVGVVLPVQVALRPVPAPVAARVPQTRDYQYAVAGDRVLLVSPANRIVVGVFRADPEPPASVGRRAQ
jgi:hypothetical protein